MGRRVDHRAKSGVAHDVLRHRLSAYGPCGSLSARRKIAGESGKRAQMHAAFRDHSAASASGGCTTVSTGAGLSAGCLTLNQAA
jgi:hypothetical protein